MSNEQSSSSSPSQPQTDERPTSDTTQSPAGRPSANSTPGRIQDSEILATLQTVTEQLGHSPTVTEYTEHSDGPSVTLIQRRFGSWNEAKEAAELETYDTQGYQPTPDLNRDYFSSIDTPAKAYWLGVLFVNTAVRKNNGARVCALEYPEQRAHFVHGFKDTVETSRDVSYLAQNSSDRSDRVRLCLRDQAFIDSLVEAGYPDVDETVKRFPDLSPDHWPAFIRGYLECGGYRNQGWRISVTTEAKATQLKAQLQRLGAKRPTVSHTARPPHSIVRVHNVFDVEAIFTACWPEVEATTPSWTPYAESVRGYLQAEHPYPGTVPYLSADD